MKPIKLKEKENKTEENNDEKDKHYAEAFLEGVPFLGGFLKELGKTDVFKERFKEVNKKIEENLKKRGRKEWAVESRVSIRPLFEEIKQNEKVTSAIVIKEDYFYGKKGDKLILAVKVPKENALLKIEGKNLVIKSGNFHKKIELPVYFKNIKKKAYKQGVLLVELTK